MVRKSMLPTHGVAPELLLLLADEQLHWLLLLPPELWGPP
jgi:hypothetical protein